VIQAAEAGQRLRKHNPDGHRCLRIAENTTGSPNFLGNKKVYLNLVDQAGQTTGWVPEGTWIVAAPSARRSSRTASP
jgi:hypothetical protein